MRSQFCLASVSGILTAIDSVLVKTDLTMFLGTIWQITKPQGHKRNFIFQYQMCFFSFVFNRRENYHGNTELSSRVVHTLRFAVKHLVP